MRSSARPTSLYLLFVAVGLAIGSAPAAGGDVSAVGRPPDIRSWRHEMLPTETYEELAKAWGAYVDAHPHDASAWVHWGNALRYAGQSEAARGKYVRAFEIDSTDIVALEAYAAMKGVEMEGAELWERELTHGRLVRAALAHPDYARTYYMLYITSLQLGNEDLAAECLHRMVATGDMPRPLFDYGHNIIAGVPEGAIIFTNGDNDTYPPLAVQAILGKRPDVAIVNLSLLNTRWYIRYLRDRGVPITLDDAGVDALEHKKDDLVSAQMQRHIFQNLRAAGWPRPLYYAVTVYEGNKVLPCRTVLEGLNARILPAEGDDIGTEDFDLERSRELFDTAYRLDSVTDPLVDWEGESALSRLGFNYVAVLTRIGEGLIGQSPADAAPYLYRALAIQAFHGQQEAVGSILELWEEGDPDSRLLKKARALLDK